MVDICMYIVEGVRRGVARFKGGEGKDNRRGERGLVRQGGEELEHVI